MSPDEAMLWTGLAGGFDGAASTCAAIIRYVDLYIFYHDSFKIAAWKLRKLRLVRRSEVATTGIAPV